MSSNSQMQRLSQSALSFLSKVLLVFAVAFYWSAPSRSFQKLLGDHADRINHFSSFIIFILLLGAWASFAWASLLESLSKAPERKEPLSGGKSGIKPLWLAVAIAASSLIAVTLYHQISAPLHWEDNFHLSNVLTTPWERFNPLLRTEHHPLTNIATYLSIQALGLSKFTIELPALVFTVALLLLFLRFSLRNLSLLTTALVFGHLAVNQMSLWYMHSMRAYILAMLIALGVFSWFWEVTQGKRASLVPILALCYAACVTHLFATLFCLLSFGTYLIWAFLKRNDLSRNELNFAVRSLSIFALAVVPVYLFVLICQAMWLVKLGDFFKGGFPELSSTFLRAFGYSYVWPIRMLAVLIASLVVLNVVSKKWWSDFSTLFFSVTIAFFGVVLELLEVRLIETRFVLPFLVPFLVWVGQRLSEIERPQLRRALATTTFLLLVVAPIPSQKGVFNYLTLSTSEFDRFITRVQRETAPLKGNCYTYAGEPNLIYFSQTLYLGKYQGIDPKEQTHCQASYHIYYESPKDLAPVDTRTNKHGDYKEIFRITDRMILYKRISASLITQR